MSIATEISTTHVNVDADVCGGRPCVAGTRVRVSDVAFIIQGGGSVDDVLSAYPRLSIADVYGALTYYFDNRVAVDQSVVDETALANKMRERLGPGPMEAHELRAATSA